LAQLAGGGDPFNLFLCRDDVLPAVADLLTDAPGDDLP
jgi:hypothetical protein